MDERDKELYDKAYSYFEYHAGQRINMINYFIGIFGACVALYGTLISSVPLACALISVFLFVVSLLFYFIDIRNKFDVKQSQEVLCRFEQKYNSQLDDEHPIYGAFLNEDNKFMLYDRKFRRSDEEYKELSRQKKQVKDGKAADELSAFMLKYPEFTEDDVKSSVMSHSIPHLSSCIKFLYYLCMLISIIGVAFAVFSFFM